MFTEGELYKTVIISEINDPHVYVKECQNYEKIKLLRENSVLEENSLELEREEGSC